MGRKRRPETIGIVGVPPWKIMQERLARGDVLVDLDEPVADMPVRNGYLPTNYCSILKRVVSNIFSLRGAGRLDRVIACIGEDKCDGMRHIARWLTTTTDIPIVQVRNTNRDGCGAPVSESQLPLLTKMELIVNSVFSSPKPPEPLRKTKPVCGFWGVPPYDFDILNLFPNATHIFGWTRCMENKTPAILTLSVTYLPGSPLFFSPSPSARNQP